MLILLMAHAFAADPFVPDANTVLLLHGDGGIADDSASNHTVTVGGNAAVSTADPAVGTGSFVFDGDGDYLSIPQSADFDFGTDGDYTIETWVKTATPSADAFWRRLFGFGTNADSRMHLIMTATTAYGGAVGGLTAWNNAGLLSGGVDLSDGQWHHVALVRFGQTHYLWIDGALDRQTTVTTPIDMANAAELVIGSYTGGVNGNFDGELDEFRISDTARYLFPFDRDDPTYQDPPVPNFLNDADTVLVLHGDEDLDDSSPVGRMVTAVGDPEFGAPGARVGSGSIRFDGDDHLVIAQSSDFDWSGGEYTVEVWVRFVTSVQDNGFWPRIWAFGTNAHNRLHLITEIDTSYGSVPGAAHAWAGGHGTVLGSPGSLGLAVGSTALNDGAWHHIAVVGTDGDVLLFADGVLEANAGIPTSFDNDGNLIIGGYGSEVAGHWIGEIDELRISAVPRYTQDFDPIQENSCGDNVCHPTIGETGDTCPADCVETCDGHDDDFDGLIDEDNVCRCRSGTFLGSDYLACPAQTTWDNALLACANFGYDMLEINDPIEERDMTRRLYRTWAPRVWWLGATDRDQEGTFEWLSGNPMVIAPWQAGQPDNDAGGQDCLGMYPATTFWYDMRCEREMSFICERPASP